MVVFTHKETLEDPIPLASPGKLSSDVISSPGTACGGEQPRSVFGPRDRGVQMSPRRRTVPRVARHSCSIHTNSESKYTVQRFSGKSPHVVCVPEDTGPPWVPDYHPLPSPRLQLEVPFHGNPLGFPARHLGDVITRTVGMTVMGTSDLWEVLVYSGFRPYWGCVCWSVSCTAFIFLCLLNAVFPSREVTDCNITHSVFSFRTTQNTDW